MNRWTIHGLLVFPVLSENIISSIENLECQWNSRKMLWHLRDIPTRILIEWQYPLGVLYVFVCSELWQNAGLIYISDMCLEEVLPADTPPDALCLQGGGWHNLQWWKYVKALNTRKSSHQRINGWRDGGFFQSILLPHLYQKTLHHKQSLTFLRLLFLGMSPRYP